MRSAHAEWAVLLWCSVPTCGATAAASEETTQPRAVQWLCFRCSPRKYRQRRRELQLAQLQDHLLPLLAAIWTEVAVSSAGLGLMTTVLAERRKRASRARIAGADGKSATFSPCSERIHHLHPQQRQVASHLAAALALQHLTSHRNRSTRLCRSSDIESAHEASRARSEATVA